MFQLTEEEYAALRSQFAPLKTGRGQHRKYLPYVFTEHGTIMASMILNSPRATQVSVYVVRAFIRLRELVVSNKELAQRLDELENKADLIDLKHDTFEHNTRVQLKQVFEAIRELGAPPEPPKKRRIGFAPFEDESPIKSKAVKAAKGKA